MIVTKFLNEPMEQCYVIRGVTVSLWRPSSLYIATILGLIPAIMVILIASVTFNNIIVALIGMAVGLLPFISSFVLFKGKYLLGSITNFVYGVLLLMFLQTFSQEIYPVLAKLEDTERQRLLGLFFMLALFEILSGLTGLLARSMALKEKRKQGGI